jgi:hypothetical protein
MVIFRFISSVIEQSQQDQEASIVPQGLSWILGERGLDIFVVLPAEMTGGDTVFFDVPMIPG